MMLQVKNCKHLCLLTLVAVMMSLFVTSCKNKDNDDINPLVGDVSKPAWTDPENYDYSSSMTAIVKVDMSGTYSAAQLKAVGYQMTNDDMLAAFCGNTCLGVGVWKDDYKAFWLYIAAPENGDQVTLKYYSSVFKHIYTAESFPYQNGEQKGSPSQPYTPSWTLSE